MKIISITPFVNKSNSKPPLWNGIVTNLMKSVVKELIFSKNIL
jgi:hypothetical protein